MESAVRRPRASEERLDELLAAVRHVLRDRGYDAMTMDDVAQRARCSKATLYRLFSTKVLLVVAAVRATEPLGLESIDTGSLRSDLLAITERWTTHAHQETALLAALTHAMLAHEELASAVRSALLEPHALLLASAVDRAVRRGELATRPVCLDLLPHVLVSMSVARPLVDGTRVDTDYLRRVVDETLLPALTHRRSHTFDDELTVDHSSTRTPPGSPASARPGLSAPRSRTT